MPDEIKPERKINRVKIYAIAAAGFLVANTLFETLIPEIENRTQTFLYPIFPYTRIGLLIITILVTSHYVRKRTGRPKKHIALRVIKWIIIVVIFYGLVMGSVFALDEAELDRMRQNRPETPVFTVPERVILEPAQ